MGDGGANHSIIREEWETEISSHNIEALDQILLNCGLVYLSKWSRERETYETGT